MMIDLSQYDFMALVLWAGGALLAGLAIVPIVGLLRHRDQVGADRMRRTFELFFPQQMSMEDVLGALRALSGLDKPELLEPVYAVTFEHYADITGERYFLHVPGHMRARVDELLEDHLDVTIEPVSEDEDPVRTTQWQHAIEIGMKGREALCIIDPVRSSLTIGTRFKHMAQGEQAVMQWCLYPTHPVKPTPETKEKETEHTFNAVCRVGAVGEYPDHLAKDLVSGLLHVQAHPHQFVKWRRSGAAARISSRAGTTGYPIYLNTKELATVIGWPLTGGSVYKAKRIPPTVAHDSEGILLGESNSPRARGRRIAVPLEGLFTHMHIMGGTGCLHPETPIYDPVDGSTRTVLERYRLGRSFHVFSLDGDNVVIARAEPPIRYHKVPMYRVTNGRSSTIVTGQHRIWDGSAYVETSALVRRQRSGPFPLPTILGRDLLRLRLDAQRWIGRAAGFQDHSGLSHRFDGPQPLPDAGSVQAPFQPLAGAPAPYCSCGGKGDLAHRPRHSRRHQPPVRLSKSNSLLPENRGLGMLGLPYGDTFSLPYWLRPLFARFAPGSALGQKGLYTVQSVHQSIGCNYARAATQSHASERSVELLYTTPRRRATTPYDLGRQRQSSAQVAQPVLCEGSFAVPLKSYSHNNRYWVEQIEDETYYDFHVPCLENYYAGGLFHHNTGKSNFLLTPGLQAIDRGNIAVVVIEPAGDLAYDFLDRIPAHRKDDVILLDPTDTNWPVGINVMAGNDPERIRGHIVGMIKNIAPDSWGHRLERILGNTVYTAALNHLTFYDLRPLLTNKHFRSQQVRRISRQTHPDVHEEWDYVESITDSAVDSVINKLNTFLGYETVRNIVAQQQGLDFDALIREHKILLVPLPAARIGLAGAQAIGQLVMELVWDAAMRQLLGHREASMVIMDEFHHFSGSSLSSSDRFAEARKYRQAYVIANQYSKQLEDKVAETIKMNVQNQIVFRLAPDDAKHVAGIYPPLKPEDLSSLPRWGVAARLMGSQGYTPTVTFKTFPAPHKTGFRQYIIEQTRANYAKPLAEVRAEIAAKHQGPPPTQRPKRGQREA